MSPTKNCECKFLTNADVEMFLARKSTKEKRTRFFSINFFLHFIKPKLKRITEAQRWERETTALGKCYNVERRERKFRERKMSQQKEYRLPGRSLPVLFHSKEVPGHASHIIPLKATSIHWRQRSYKQEHTRRMKESGSKHMMETHSFPCFVKKRYHSGSEPIGLHTRRAAGRHPTARPRDEQKNVMDADSERSGMHVAFAHKLIRLLALFVSALFQQSFHKVCPITWAQPSPLKHRPPPLTASLHAPFALCTPQKGVETGCIQGTSRRN